MSTTPEVTIESLQAEVARLKAHADDLLAERRAEKQRREAAETELAGLKEAHQAANARIDDLTLTGPVLRALEGATRVPPKEARRALEERGFEFRIGKEGVAVAVEGEREIPLADLKGHLAEKRTEAGDGSLDWLLPDLPRGSGARFGGTTPKAAPTPVRTPLGLR